MTPAIENSLDTTSKENPCSKNFDRQKQQKFLALLFTSLITISSIYLFEIQSCLFRVDNFHLVTYQLSVFITSFCFLILMSTKSYWKKAYGMERRHSSAYLTNEYFFNIFYFNKIRIGGRSKEKSKEEELNDLLDITPHTATPIEYLNIKKSIFSPRRQIKSNFYMLFFSIFTINVWILGNYIYGYLINSKLLKPMDTGKAMPDLVQVILSVIGGFGTSIFFKIVIFDLFELNFSMNDLNIGDFSWNNSKKLDTSILLNDSKNQPVFEEELINKGKIFINFFTKLFCQLEY